MSIKDKREREREREKEWIVNLPVYYGGLVAAKARFTHRSLKTFMMRIHSRNKLQKRLRAHNDADSDAYI